MQLKTVVVCFALAVSVSACSSKEEIAYNSELNSMEKVLIELETFANKDEICLEEFEKLAMTVKTQSESVRESVKKLTEVKYMPTDKQKARALDLEARLSKALEKAMQAAKIC